MDYYRRLNDRDRKKINFYKKLKKSAKKGIKWWSIFCAIVCLFGVGTIFLYKFVDSGQSSDFSHCFSSFGLCASKSKNSDDTDGMSELAKKEFQREDAKSESIDNKITEEHKAEGDISENVEQDNSYDFSQWNETCSPEQIVINKDNPIAENCVVKTKNCRGKEINVCASEDLESMILDAKKEGIVLWISSGYRDVNYQTKLFNRQIERENSKAVISPEEAAKRAAVVVAKPGTSEHNTGLAVDFNGVEDDFYKTKEYKWLMDNAHKYGFIERYQKKWKNYTGVIYEPWHFRYVGKELAPKVKESGLCLEKYVMDYLIKK